MIVNLLTEDNLPSYHREIATRFGPDGAWGQWVGQWTAEEGRHAIAIRDYLLVTRGVDPVALEVGRMVHMAAGYDSGDKSPIEALAYVFIPGTWQPASATATPAGRLDVRSPEQLLTRIATDENLHMVFYRNLVGRRARYRAERDHAGDRSRGDQLPDARERHAGLRGIMPSRSPRPASTTCVRIWMMSCARFLRFWRIFERENLDGEAGSRAR